MPILFVHGVNVRDRSLFEQITPLLRHWVCPVLSAQPEQVRIEDAYWGDLGVRFAWDGASRPRSRILGMGAAAASTELSTRMETALSLGTLLPATPTSVAAPAPSLLAPGFGPPAAPGVAGKASHRRLRDLAPPDLADLLYGVMAQTPTGSGTAPTPQALARFAVLADEVTHDASVQAGLHSAPGLAEEIDLLGQALAAAQAGTREPAVLGMGFSFKENWRSVRERLGELFQRADDLPLYAASVGLLEARKWAHEAIALFAGDVVTYIGSRERDRPGPIVQRVLDQLMALDTARATSGEPLVVLTHSMGGQIVYDLLSWFIPQLPGPHKPRVDFWCATASQVGFFEEAKLFLASDPALRTPSKLPFPAAHLGAWWNVWDPNDVLSFTAQPIFDGVDDGAYDSGMPLTRAHGGYLQRPSFYRRFAEKLEASSSVRRKAP